jgi:hypothetical protein
VDAVEWVLILDVTKVEGVIVNVVVVEVAIAEGVDESIDEGVG